LPVTLSISKKVRRYWWAVVQNSSLHEADDGQCRGKKTGSRWLLEETRRMTGVCIYGIQLIDIGGNNDE